MRLMIKQIFSLLVAFSVLCGLLMVTAGAYVDACDIEFSEDGIFQIDEDGTYVLPDDEATGEIIVSAGVQNVTISGSGVEWDNDLEGDNYGAITGVEYQDLYIDCSATPGITLTLSDLSVANGDDNVSAAAQFNTLNFSGSGNTLIFDGTVVISHEAPSSSPAAIHVGAGTELTITATTGAQVYLYKKSLGAAVGGDVSESCGTIAFGEENGANDFHVFMLGNHLGSTIGSGGNCSLSNGDITFHSGIYNIVSYSSGAAIGTGGANSCTAGDVYVTAGLLNVNADWNGAAIGAGGASGGTPAAANGGVLHITGGSLRTYVDLNALPKWTTNFDVTTCGVNNVVITTTRVNADDQNVYQLVVPSGNNSAADTYTIKVDGQICYEGPRYAYSYLYENASRDATDGSKVNTIPPGVPGSWTSTDDETNFYLYVTGSNHTLEVNGAAYQAVWDNDAETFTISAAGDLGEPTDIPTEDIVNSTARAATVTTGIADGTATLHVACDKACVVAYTTDDGATYTKLTATKNSDGGYDFSVVYTNGMKFTVAIKGDIDHDGVINDADVHTITAEQLSETDAFTTLEDLIADLNGNGNIDSADVIQLAAAKLGKLTLSW